MKTILFLFGFFSFLLINSAQGQFSRNNLLDPNQLAKKVTAKLDSTVLGVRNELDQQIDGVEQRVDSLLTDVRGEVKDVKGEILAGIGEISWRFTLVEIITALLSTVLTAFFTAYLTAKRLGVERIREEMDKMMKDVEKQVNEMKENMEP